MRKEIIKAVYLDDEVHRLADVKRGLESINSAANYIVATFEKPTLFLESVLKSESKTDVFLIDYNLSSSDWTGITVAAEIRKAKPNAVILMLSDHRSSGMPKEFLASCDDFISKDSIFEDTFPTIIKEAYLAAKKARSHLNAIVSKSLESVAGMTMKAHIIRIPSILESALRTLVVLGDHGTGKTFFYDQFIQALRKAKLPFVEVDCENDFDAQIAAIKATSIKRSNSWVLFENVQELSAKQQKKVAQLLRTCRNAGRFLFTCTDKKLLITHLLNELETQELILPPLRDRADEIPEFCNLLSQALIGGPYFIEAAAIDMLSNYSFERNNIFELRSILEKMTTYRSGTTLTLASLPPVVVKARPQNGSQHICTANCLSVDYDPKVDSLDHYIQKVTVALIRKLSEKYHLDIRGSSLSKMALKLGVSRQTLSTRISQLIEEKCLSKDEGKMWYGQRK